MYRKGNAMSTVKEILFLFKTHLDIGYTDFAKNVRERYIQSYIPQAMKLARELREEGGQERFVWTTGSWLVDEYLRSAHPEGKREMERAIEAGDIAWHGLPFTTHTELMDRELFEYGLSISQKLDQRFGRHTVAAKLTDVPGHTRAIVPLLAAAGIELLHIGVNPVSVSPEVPPLFRWRAPGGEELVMMYNFGYGRYTEIPGTGLAICFAHTGDNNGPQSAQPIRQMYEQMRREHPGALLRAGTLNDIVPAIRRIRDSLPLVTDEIGDSWIHGMASDPGKISQYRALLRLRRQWKASQREAVELPLLSIAEHTWGLDFKARLGDHEHYVREEFEKVRPTPGYQRLEDSWREQRGYIAQAVEALQGEPRDQAQRATGECSVPLPDTGAYRRIQDPQAMLNVGGWSIGFDGTGALTTLHNGVLHAADAGHRLGVFRYEAYSREQTDEFCRRYMDVSHFPELRELAFDDFNKLGSEKAIDRYQSCGTELTGVFVNEREAIAMLEVRADATRLYGCPQRLMLRVQPQGDAVLLDFAWWGKPASRVSEALWLGMNPVAAGCRVSKLGEWIDPRRVVRHGNIKMHATDFGLRYDAMTLETLDTALVNIGEPALWAFGDGDGDASNGVYFNLYNNFWNTNFPLWYDQDARFRFIIRPV